jgi:hypothetical protein
MGILTTTTARPRDRGACLLSVAAWADPPARAIRSPRHAAGQLPAFRRRRLGAGAHQSSAVGRVTALWIDRGARAELQLGGAAYSSRPDSSVAVLDYDDDRAQFELRRARRRLRAQSRRQRLDRDRHAESRVRRAPRRANIASTCGPRASRRRSAVVRGEGRRSAHDRRTRCARAGLPLLRRRPRDYDAEPVTRGRVRLVGGIPRATATSDPRARATCRRTWSATPTSTPTERGATCQLRPVWVPTRVTRSGRPIDTATGAGSIPGGWTWIDDAPWGFAPFHYGAGPTRQPLLGMGAGPAQTRPVYAPALVAFVGGDNFRVIGCKRAGRRVVPARAGRGVSARVQREPRLLSRASTSPTPS